MKKQHGDLEGGFKLDLAIPGLLNQDDTLQFASQSQDCGRPARSMRIYMGKVSAYFLQETKKYRLDYWIYFEKYS